MKIFHTTQDLRQLSYLLLFQRKHLPTLKLSGVNSTVRDIIFFFSIHSNVQMQHFSVQGMGMEFKGLSFRIKHSLFTTMQKTEERFPVRTLCLRAGIYFHISLKSW